MFWWKECKQKSAQTQYGLECTFRKRGISRGGWTAVTWYSGPITLRGFTLHDRLQFSREVYSFTSNFGSSSTFQLFWRNDTCSAYSLFMKLWCDGFSFEVSAFLTYLSTSVMECSNVVCLLVRPAYCSTKSFDYALKYDRIAYICTFS